MKFRYPNVTAGYVCYQNKNQSLNSAMMQMLLSKVTLPEGMYPQRVPTPGFFEELHHLEGNQILQMLSNINQGIIVNARNAGDIDSLNHHLNILLRRGLYKDVLDISLSLECQKIPLSTRYIIENAKIEEMLIGSRRLSLESYYGLSKDVLSETETSTRLKLQVTNRLLVCSFRYKIPLPIAISPTDYVSIILDILERDKRDTFKSHIDHSVVYRGISMVPMNGNEKQSEFLQRAFYHAKVAAPKCNYETLIKKENLLTLLQTLSKWTLFRGDPNKSEGYLNDMIKIDPNDSTAYSEYGLFLYDQNRFKEALKQFKFASKLGPPSVAMNKYFIAQTMMAINKNNDVEEVLKEVIVDDPMALSPVLELIDIYQKNGNVKMTQNMVRQLLNSPDLKDQLEENEIVYYTSLLV